jgi:photosynthetic reaction center H subunit
MFGIGTSSGIDLTQILLYLFWFFFAGLIWYLHRENKREGYPLESDRIGGGVTLKEGVPGVPEPKVYKLPHGGTVAVPRANDRQPELRAVQMPGSVGSPFEPASDPMTDQVGPGSIALRADTPDLTVEGKPKIVPLRASNEHRLEARDTDPRGLKVYGADGVAGGVVRDVWIDRSEEVIRYLEVEVSGEGAPRSVLLPMNFARVRKDGIDVDSVLGKQFAGVPTLRGSDTITLLEEERVMAYFGAGTLYATPSRQEPLA